MKIFKIGEEITKLDNVLRHQAINLIAGILKKKMFSLCILFNTQFPCKKPNLVQAAALIEYPTVQFINEVLTQKGNPSE